MTKFRTEIIGDCTLILGDSKYVLPTIEDAYDTTGLLMDPPYGIGENHKKVASRGKCATPTDYGDFSWDDKVVDKALISSCRIRARYQIIFGGNYYDLPPTSCWLVWDKDNGNNDYADCELAWTNLEKAVRMIKYRWAGMLQQDMKNKEKKFHPTQKPIDVMRWCLEQFPPDCNTILDPFMGSGTTGVACRQEGYGFIGIEKDEEYFDIACKRVEEAYRQPDMFIEPPKKVVQEDLL